jgi:hypothetical protein
MKVRLRLHNLPTGIARRPKGLLRKYLFHYFQWHLGEHRVKRKKLHSGCEKPRCEGVGRWFLGFA